MSLFKGFYKKSRLDRIHLLQEEGRITTEQASNLIQNNGLAMSTAENMIENVIGQYALPFGIATQFLINNENYVVPMAIEEPSVVAAASKGAQMVRQGGGFHAEVPSRLMRGQIAFQGVDKEASDRLHEWIQNHHATLLTLCRTYYPSLVKRGGGVKHISSEFFAHESRSDQTQTPSFFVLYLDIDTKEAMGANMINTILEALAQHLTPLFQEQCPDLTIEPLMAILSNNTPKCLVHASCQVPYEALASQTITGEAVAQRIQAASDLAQVDPNRATTHNKGVMNGIDAVVIATGNDWRAIEAGIHAYASHNGRYQGLSQWTCDAKKKMLNGTITLPLAVGTVGGSIPIHPSVQVAHTLLRHPNAETLMKIIACTGLAQNLAALRALVSEGIQSGHMALQARSLALSIGANEDEIGPLIEQLKNSKQFSRSHAIALLNRIRETTS